MPLNVAHPIRRTLLLVALACSAPAGQASLAAQQASLAAQEDQPRPGVQVIDGDTLEIDGQTVQLYGIDAPELGQYCDRGGELWECGVEAAQFLQKTVSFQGPPVECSPWNQGAAAPAEGEPTVGVCQIGPKVLGLTMVRNGYAMALPDSFPDYEDAEEEARNAKLGLWQSDFVPPWEWRGGKGTDPRSSDWVRRCNVKGALGSSGEAIYYVPTDHDYANVTIDRARGERMFCSDEEARAAGWTRPGKAPDQ